MKIHTLKNISIYVGKTFFHNNMFIINKKSKRFFDKSITIVIFNVYLEIDFNNKFKPF